MHHCDRCIVGVLQARAPLAASHFGERRLHVWGAAADGSLDHLKKAVAALCDEYRAPHIAGAEALPVELEDGELEEGEL